MWTSRRSHSNQYPLELLLPVSLPPPWATCDPCLPKRSSMTHQQFSPGYSGVSTLGWVPVHVKTCVCPPRADSLFLPVLWSSCAQTLLAFKAKGSAGSSSQYQTLRLRNLRQGSELSLLWENLSNRINFLSVGHPPGRLGILLSHKSAPPTFMMWLFLFGCEISFFTQIPGMFIDDYSAVSCDLGVFLRWSNLKSFYSAILSAPDTL